VITSLLAILIGLGAIRAQAQDTVTCTPTAPTIDYGAYSVLGGATLNGASSFTISCVRSGGSGALTVTYTAKLLDTPSTRQMTPPSGTDVITHQLYTNSARTSAFVWGDGTAGTTTFTGTRNWTNGSPNGTKTTAAINFYGQISPGGQDVSAASPGPSPTTYSQSLTITVTCTPSPPC
jgi:hypothetical protein